MKNKPLNLSNLIGEIELPLTSLDFLNSPRSFAVLKDGVDRFKEIVKKQRRFLAKKHHPDKGGNAEYMKRINDVCDLLLKLEAVMPRPRPIGVFDFRWSPFGGGFSYTATTSSNSTWSGTS